MKKPLLAFADEDSDEDGNTYTNSVASNKHEEKKYVPPSLQLDAINKSFDEKEDVRSLASTPRSRLSAAQRKKVDAEVLADAIEKISNKSNDSKRKEDPALFTPKGVNRITKKALDDAISKSRSGQSTPLSRGLFDPTKSINQKELLEAAKQQEESSNRVMETER